jgi:NADP-dependent 3-hydroxy acid dehydrogenase YdfG
MRSAGQNGPAALAGCVALVTGASSGIGAATIRRLAAEGAAVALVARRAERLESLAETVRAGGRNALAIQADVTNRAEAEDAADRAVAELGRLDVVVNTAGVMLLGPALEASIDDWERMVALNVLGTMYVTRAALPHLVRAAEAAPRRVVDLVNVTSTAGRVARPGAARLRPHEVRCRRVLGVAPAGADPAARSCQRGRAGHRRHRARLPPQ